MPRTSLLLGSSLVLLLSACSMRGEQPEALVLAPTESNTGLTDEATADAQPPSSTPVETASAEPSRMKRMEGEKSEAPRPDAVAQAPVRPNEESTPLGALTGASSGEGRYGAGGLAGRGSGNIGYGAPPPPPSPSPKATTSRAPAKDEARSRSSYDGDDGLAEPDSRDNRVVTGAERFTDHGVNPFTVVADDAQSTFGMDVDTASYTVVRKRLIDGQLPDTAAVRVEEFVNYFDYGYAAPRDGSPFAVHMSAMPDPFREGRHILSVGVQAKEVDRDEREPVHLTFLVDISGSMSSADKLPLAQEAMHLLVDSLQESDTVALATYAGATRKVLEPTSAVNKRKIHEAIDQLNAGGSTAMSSGIDIAYEMAWKSFEQGHENRVIVMSDGDANVGKTSWDDLLSQIKTYADKGVTLSTIGLGMGNYNDSLMQQLSNKGDGNNYYIDDEEQARRVFVDQLGGTLVTVARDAKIQVEFNPESVYAYRLIGYENRDIADKDFRNDKVDAGEVGAGHSVTALYEVILREGYERDLATVRLRWEKPGADVGHGGTGAVEKSFGFLDHALAERVDQADKDLRIAYAAATFAEVLRQSSEVSELSMDALIAYAKEARRAGEADDVELVKMMERSRSLGAGTPSGSVSHR